jgi:hypothetical protein
VKGSPSAAVLQSRVLADPFPFPITEPFFVTWIKEKIVLEVLRRKQS